MIKNQFLRPVKNWFLLCLFITSYLSLAAQSLDAELQNNTSYQLLIKSPGNLAEIFNLKAAAGQNQLQADKNMPVRINREIKVVDGGAELNLTVEALADTYFSLQGKFQAQGFSYDTSYTFLPGFWYRKNLRSPDKAPSVRVSKNWIVREDRLSAPLAGIFDREKQMSYSLARLDKVDEIALAPLNQGEVILSGRTELGAVGFGEENGQPYLAFAYPYQEAPHTYYRKLTLGPPVTTFLSLKKGERVTLRYRLMKFAATDYADYMRQIWTRSYDLYQPKPVAENKFSDTEVKNILAKFYKQSFVTAGNLKGFSGIHLQTHVVEKRPVLEVGFIGRVLLNAFNALEHGEQHQDQDLENMAYDVMNSYEQNGFAPTGFFREVVNAEKNTEATTYSIRRQSEGVYATLLYLDYEKRKGRHHKVWEDKIRRLLDIMLQLQARDGSFPRKFKGDRQLVDATGGSSPSAVLPLVMGFKYFGDTNYLNAARKVIDYQEREIISKSDYFSSTLDADCEDKEASLYAATALYYMAMVTKGKEQERYVNLARQAAYFTLSWYYLWDVPFAPGQMLGDVGLKSRGWGNVSVENNHIDVFIFEFDEVLKWLAQETKEQRFTDFANVIRTSMREQLLPYQGHMVGIAKEGYYPEVVQHTQWDYGHFGKGFYNLHFAPGWTVASIWELLTDERAKTYLTRKR
ncbi:hypothetical protein [Adhaeribacter rhizoryzae]|uniref:Uncharacterized protein n=1 Tax=Adhaeribacter rhizoryzae TaxID=2607907 RepID=A0A5M6DKC8_9BACT|nr:hypothetical protein [Adhaeribacter rhizoryzae]KAA5545775.1 hypothetical protein F0145_12650 [Adhaeribacter rhizoryzae]